MRLMDRTRACEIIATYGADPARWPDEERASLLAAIQADPTLQRQVDEAAALDAMLLDWARAPMPTAQHMDTGALADRISMPRRRWLPTAVFGGSVAAALALVALVAPSDSSPTGPAMTAAVGDEAQIDAAPRLEDSQLWAMVFTPTPDEEALI